MVTFPQTVCIFEIKVIMRMTASRRHMTGARSVPASFQYEEAFSMVSFVQIQFPLRVSKIRYRNNVQGKNVKSSLLIYYPMSKFSTIDCMLRYEKTLRCPRFITLALFYDKRTHNNYIGYFKKIMCRPHSKTQPANLSNKRKFNAQGCEIMK